MINIVKIKEFIYEKFITRIRPIAVWCAAGLGTLFFAWLATLFLRYKIHQGESLALIVLALLGCVFIGAAFVWIFCVMAYTRFTFWRTIVLPHAIRLEEAMIMLHQHTNFERLEAIRHHEIRVFMSREAVPRGGVQNITCKEITDFLSPMLLGLNRFFALGSEHYCCDAAQIEGIIANIKATWCPHAEQPENLADIVAAHERTIEKLQEKYKESRHNYTAASAREGSLKKKIAEIEQHIAVLIELAHITTQEVKPPRTVTREQIKQKYLKIAKIYGITSAPADYVELFRKTMPQELIQGDGAPRQGDDTPKT